MELRQLRYFMRVVESGSFSQAAASLGVVTSALSQQVSKLESELSTRLLQRTSTGVRPTDAGLAFWRQCQLALRHVDAAANAAKGARLSGHVSVGMPPSTASVMGLAFLQAMHERYPDLRLHLVEGLSGHLAQMLNARQLDLAVLFQVDAARRWTVQPLLDEKLFVMGPQTVAGMPTGNSTSLSRLKALPLILPSAPHNLRTLVDAAFDRAGIQPQVVAEIDGLALLMDAVGGGMGATIQPGAAASRLSDGQIRLVQVSDAHARRPNLLVSLSDDELSPAGLAARVVMTDVARRLVGDGHWIGASIHES